MCDSPEHQLLSSPDTLSPTLEGQRKYTTYLSCARASPAATYPQRTVPRSAFRSRLATTVRFKTDLDFGQFQRLVQCVALQNTLHRVRPRPPHPFSNTNGILKTRAAYAASQGRHPSHLSLTLARRRRRRIVAKGTRKTRAPKGLFQKRYRSIPRDAVVRATRSSRLVEFRWRFRLVETVSGEDNS